MKELINIVNSKFQAIIDELKNQKTTLEEKLKRVAEDIDKKVIIASKYKEDVEKSNSIISDLEKEIESLKKDLQELHDKFESTGFKSILEAGNKEINGKIIDNNTKISEQQENIKRYQDEVQGLRDELTTLKESKHNLEKELANTTVALKYYSARTDELTIYAIENSDKLEDYVKVDEPDDVQEEIVSKDIDGTIFEEINEISNGDKEISEEELNEVLNTKYIEETEEPEELTKTQMLDDIVTKTQAIIKNANSEEEFLSLLDEPIEEVKQETIEEQPMEETAPETESIERVEEDTQQAVEQSINSFDELMKDIDSTLDDTTPVATEELIVTEPVEEVVPTTEETIPQEETTTVEPIEEVQPVESTEVVPQEESVVVGEPITEVQEEPTDDIMSNLTTVSLDGENNPVKDTIQKLGLNYNEFSNEINNISNIDYDQALRIIDCLDLHFIDIKNVYKNPTILVTMRPDVLDKVLDLLELVGCTPTTFNYIFKYLDKIDVNQLEQRAKVKTDSVIMLLHDVVHGLELSNISEVLGLTDEEVKMLESKLETKEYNAMCGFTDVVKANYDTLNEFHIADIKKCFTEHPKRFLCNPDVFETILDKYDPQDLVRCINKNVAVIDRL